LNVQSGEQHQDVEHVQPYGLVSNVQPPTQGATGSNTAAESFIVYMSSDRSHPVSLVSGDRRYRMMNLAPGEVALHDDQGQQLHLTRKGMVTTVLNSQSHTHQIMPDKSSAMNKDQQQRGSSGGTQSATSQFGQTPWATLIANNKQAPFAYHSIDKTSRTTSHPGTVIHNIWDANDAKDPTIQASKKKVVHSNTLDQKKGSILSINKGKHTRTVDPDKGITDSVGNGGNNTHSRTMNPQSGGGITDSVAGGKHTRIIDAIKGIIDNTSASHSRTAAQGISDTAPNINHAGNTNLQGNTSITQNLNVSGLTSLLGSLSATGGMSTGALVVAPDSAGGLVQATMGLAVTNGAATDTLTASGLISANDALAVTHGITTDTFAASTSATVNNMEVELGPVANGLNTQTASYVLQLSDSGMIIEMNCAGANTLTIPPHSSVAFSYAPPARIDVVQTGAGITTLVAGAGVTILSNNGMIINGQYTGVNLYQRALNTWVATGSLI